MIVFTLRLKLRKENTNHIARSVVPLLAPTRVQPGCVSCRLYRDLDDPDALMLIEEWNSREALDHHLRSDDYRTVLEAMESSEREPELHFDTISTREGIEVVQQARINTIGYRKQPFDDAC
jgi:quinol monooxygenase YgiN